MIVLLLSVPLLLVLFVVKGVTGAAMRDPHTWGHMPALEKLGRAVPGGWLSRMRYVALALLVAGVAFEAVRERSQSAGELSFAQSMKQASTSWAAARGLFPQPIPLYGPTWLPIPLRTAAVPLPETVSSNLNDPASTAMTICYCADNSDPSLALSIASIHSGTTPTLLQTLHPDWSVPLRIGALSGEFISNSATKQAAFVWQIGQWSYSAQMVGVDVSEFLRIVAGLQLV